MDKNEGSEVLSKEFLQHISDAGLDSSPRKRIKPTPKKFASQAVAGGMASS